MLAIVPACAFGQSASPNTEFTLTVHDANGNPVQNLKPVDFTLTIGSQPQPILRLEEHTPSTPTQLLEPLNLPPGTFTDYTPIPAGATLNILLLDALNTPTKSSAFVRSQLQQYVAHANPANRVAIFGLADHIILLQGFSAHQQPLQDAVEHKLIRRANTDAAASEVLLTANLQQFEAQVASVDAQFHPQLTLDALNSLAHFLVGLPGRKNILWVSASFPLDLFAANPDLNADELRETRALLTNARVSFYPIDARSLLPAKSAKEIPQPQLQQRAIMSQLAKASGGQTFFATTDLAATVNHAIETASSYYTLVFAPANGDQSIHLTAINPSLKLAYPRTLYAPPATQPLSNAYAHAAMARGAPAPADILFKVRVLPAGSGTEPAVTSGNIQNPDYRVLGPFQRFAVEFVAPTGQFDLTAQPDGHHSGKVEFIANVYDINGRLLNAEGKTATLNVPLADYERFLQYPIALHLEISAPVREESYLRLAIHDLATGRFGVVELPISSVSHLPPAVPSPSVSTPPR